jgi:hypothetical protein
VLIELMQELNDYPAPAPPASRQRALERDYAGVVVALDLMTQNGPLSFLSTTTVFGTPVDITLSELALECFFPANNETATALQKLAQERAGTGDRSGS